MTDPVYRSQWDPDGSQRINDCGPACVAMVLDAFGRHETINAISAEIEPTDTGTTSDQLAGALLRRGVNAMVWTGTGYPTLPAICLVRYDGFNRDSVQDIAFRGWHWLVLLGINELTAIVHDPDYAGSRRAEGDYKRYGRGEFDRAFIPYGASKIAVVWPPAGQEVQPSAANPK